MALVMASSAELASFRAPRYFSHLVRNHREAAAGGTGAGRFDGGVERQEVGLLADLGNRADARSWARVRPPAAGFFDAGANAHHPFDGAANRRQRRTQPAQAGGIFNGFARSWSGWFLDLAEASREVRVRVAARQTLQADPA